MKLLASDYDDTLFIEQQVSQQDLKMIKAFQKAGHLFGINSGRHLDSIFEECERFGLHCDFYIGNNGTIVLNKHKEILYINKFEENLVQEIINYFRENLKEEVYFISVNNGYQFGREFFNEGCDFLPHHTDSLEKYLQAPISTMFSQIIDKSKTMELVNQLNKVFEGRAYFYGNAPFIDIVNEPIDKAIGLEKYIQLMNLDENDCYVVGDSYNDISMFKRFNSFVIKAAKDSVKQFADEEVSSVSEVIQKIMLDDMNF